MIHLALWAACAAQAYDHGDATSDEQLVLEMINRARANPAAEGTRLSLSMTEGITDPDTLTNAVAQPPLAMNPLLLQIARAHSRDMWQRNFFDHPNPDGLDPFDRMTNAGYAWTSAAENIIVSSGFQASPGGFHNSLVIDTGITDRGHRTNLMDWANTTPAPAPRREVGIGYFSSATANGGGWRTFMTEDFGRRSGGGPFLVGVVHRDADADSFYDIGEGLPGVTITITGGGTAVSAPGGGFAIPCPTSGTIAVTATGGPLNAILSANVTFGAQNLYLAFKPTAGQILDTDGDGLPNAYETAYGLDINVNDTAGDADGDGFSNLVEYQRGSNPALAGSFPGSGTGSSDAPPPTTAAPSGGGGGGGGGCGLLGAEALLLLLLLRRR